MAPGDTVVFRFIEAADVTPPAEIVPTDSPQYVAEQAAFAESLKNLVPDRQPAVRLHQVLSLEYRLNGQPPAIASFVRGEEHMLCDLIWVKQRPDQCRLSVRSFGDKAKPEHSPSTRWLDATLALNDEFAVRIAA